MLIWPAHSLIDATKRRDRIDRELIGRWISHLIEHKVNSIFWRGMYVGRATYHSTVVPVMQVAKTIDFVGSKYPGTGAAETLAEFNDLAAAVAPFDTFQAVRQQSKRQGLAFYADISPFDKYFPGLEETFYEAHPELWLVSRDQKQRLRGLPCYAETMARERLLSEVKELIDREVDGISINLLSHMGGFKENAPFGFNPAVVNMYKERWGGDILAGPYDPARFSQLQGEIFTGVLRDIRRLLGPKRRLSIAVPQTAGGAEYVVYCGTYRIDLAWRTWMREGLVNDLMVMPQNDQSSVTPIALQVKAAAPKGKVFLMRKVRNPAMVPIVTEELAAIRAGGLDGLIVSEGRIFEPAHTPWCRLFQ